MESLDSEQLEEFIKAFEEVHADALEDPYNPKKANSSNLNLDPDFISEYYESIQSSSDEEQGHEKSEEKKDKIKVSEQLSQEDLKNKKCNRWENIIQALRKEASSTEKPLQKQLNKTLNKLQREAHDAIKYGNIETL